MDESLHGVRIRTDVPLSPGERIVTGMFALQAADDRVAGRPEAAVGRPATGAAVFLPWPSSEAYIDLMVKRWN
jgi:hypothetical protein